MHKKSYLLLYACFTDETDTRLLHPVLVSTLGGGGGGGGRRRRNQTGNWRGYRKKKLSKG